MFQSTELSLLIKFYLATLPEASPPISLVTSSTVTKLESPFMVCFKQDAATAKSKAFEKLGLEDEAFLAAQGVLIKDMDKIKNDAKSSPPRKGVFP